jgi:hypothetical protein
LTPYSKKELKRALEGRIRNSEIDKRLLADIELACPDAASEREKAKKTFEGDKRRNPARAIRLETWRLMTTQDDITHT